MTVVIKSSEIQHWCKSKNKIEITENDGTLPKRVDFLSEVLKLTSSCGSYAG